VTERRGNAIVRSYVRCSYTAPVIVIFERKCQK